MQWPWKRRRKPDPSPESSASALRQLYRNYRRQAQMWGLVILSAVVVSGLFFLSMVFTKISLYTFAIPGVVVLFAGYHLQKCRAMVTILRHALMIQQEIDKVDEQRRKEAEAAERAAAAAEEAEQKRVEEETKAAQARAAYDRGHDDPPPTDAG